MAYRVLNLTTGNDHGLVSRENRPLNETLDAFFAHMASVGEPITYVEVRFTNRTVRYSHEND